MKKIYQCQGGKFLIPQKNFCFIKMVNSMECHFQSSLHLGNKLYLCEHCWHHFCYLHHQPDDHNCKVESSENFVCEFLMCNASSDMNFCFDCFKSFCKNHFDSEDHNCTNSSVECKSLRCKKSASIKCQHCQKFYCVFHFLPDEHECFC